MSAGTRKKDPKSPELELELTLSLPKIRDGDGEDDTDQEEEEEENLTTDVSWPSSCDFSCLSSTAEDDHSEVYNDVDHDSSWGYPAEVTLATTSSSSMVVLGCPRCLMYVMLSEVKPRCPRCKSTELIDLYSEDLSTKKKTT